MNLVYITIISLIVLLAISYGVSAFFSRQIKKKVVEHIDSMKIEIHTTKSVSMKVKFKKQLTMENGCVYPHYQFITSDGKTFKKDGSIPILDSLPYNENTDNFLPCEVYTSIVACNNIELRSLADIHTVLGLDKNSAICFGTIPFTARDTYRSVIVNALPNIIHSFVSQFSQISLISYNDETLYDACIYEQYPIIEKRTKRSFQELSFIRNWPLLPSNLLLYFAQYKKFEKIIFNTTEV